MLLSLSSDFLLPLNRRCPNQTIDFLFRFSSMARDCSRFRIPGPESDRNHSRVSSGQGHVEPLIGLRFGVNCLQPNTVEATRNLRLFRRKLHGFRQSMTLLLTLLPPALHWKCDPLERFRIPLRATRPGGFSRQSSDPAASSSSRCIQDPVPCSCRRKDRAVRSLATAP